MGGGGATAAGAPGDEDAAVDPLSGVLAAAGSADEDTVLLLERLSGAATSAAADLPLARDSEAEGSADDDSALPDARDSVAALGVSALALASGSTMVTAATGRLDEDCLRVPLRGRVPLPPSASVRVDRRGERPDLERPESRRCRVPLVLLAK